MNISEFRAAGVANADSMDANSRRRVVAAGLAAAALVLLRRNRHKAAYQLHTAGYAAV